MAAKLIILVALIAVTAVSVGAEKASVAKDIVEALREVKNFLSVAKEVYKRPYATWKEVHRVRYVRT